MDDVKYTTIKIPRFLLDSIAIVKAVAVLNKNKYEKLREELGVPRFKGRGHRRYEPSLGEIVWVGLRALRKLLEKLGCEDEE